MFDQFFYLSGNKLEYSKNFGYLQIDKKGKFLCNFGDIKTFLKEEEKA